MSEKDDDRARRLTQRTHVDDVPERHNNALRSYESEPKNLPPGFSTMQHPITKRWHIFRMNPAFFPSYVRPHGYLCEDAACHALWLYYVTARRTWEEERNMLTLRLEDEPEPVPATYRNILAGIAPVYGVQPEEMTKHWAHVDRQCDYLEMPRMEDFPALRMDRPIVIITKDLN